MIILLRLMNIMVCFITVYLPLYSFVVTGRFVTYQGYIRLFKPFSLM